jgi:hypothetical protein
LAKFLKVELTELVFELNVALKNSSSDITRKICFDQIRNSVSGASHLTNLQILLIATISSNANEFQKKIFAEIKNNSN